MHILVFLLPLTFQRASLGVDVLSQVSEVCWRKHLRRYWCSNASVGMKDIRMKPSQRSWRKTHPPVPAHPHPHPLNSLNRIIKASWLFISTSLKGLADLQICSARLRFTQHQFGRNHRNAQGAEKLLTRRNFKKMTAQLSKPIFSKFSSQSVILECRTW